MLVRLFKNNDYAGIFAIPVFGLMVWVLCYFLLPAQQISFSGSVFLHFIPRNPELLWVYKLFSFLLALSGAYLLDLTLQRFELTQKGNHVPAGMYLLFSAILSNESILHPIIPANLCIIGAFLLFLDTYRHDNAYSRLFDAAFLIAMAVLFYTPMLFLFPLSFVALVILRPYKFREWILVIIGMFLPVLILALTFFVLDISAAQFIIPLSEVSGSFSIPENRAGSLVINFMVIVLTIPTLIFELSSGYGGKLATQKGKVLLSWIGALLLPGIFYFRTDCSFSAIGMILPLSIFVGDFLGQLKRRFWAELLMLLFLVALVISQLQSFNLI